MLLFFASLALGKDPAPAPSTQNELPIGKATGGTVKDDADAHYGFTATTPGLLTVALRGPGSTDLKLLVTDEDGQPLRDARSDQDLGGERGAEQLTVVLPYPGKFGIAIEASDDGSFQIGASWLPMPEVGHPPDEDGRPAGGAKVAVGEAKSDQLDVAHGDLADWYAFTIKSAGTLTVLTKGTEGDLLLDAFRSGEYHEPAEHSDSDMQDVRANESVSFHVEGGQTVLFRVSTNSSGSEPIQYKLSSGIIPD